MALTIADIEDAITRRNVAYVEATRISAELAKRGVIKDKPDGKTEWRCAKWDEQAPP